MQFGLVEATVGAGGGENAAVAEVLALLEVAVEQGLDHPILRIAPARVLDQPVGIDGIGRACDTVEGELDAFGFTGLLDCRKNLRYPLLGTELRHHVALPVDALGRHIGVELERPPLDREFGGPAGVGALEAALADVAPGTDRVGDNGDVHRASIVADHPWCERPCTNSGLRRFLTPRRASADHGPIVTKGADRLSEFSRYERGLERAPANHTALTPCDFMARAAAIYPARTAVVHGALRRSYAETYERCRRLAGALVARGVGLGDTVSIMAPNVPAMLEAHFGVPMAGAVLNALNIRLDAASVALMLGHARSRVLIADAAFASVVEEALARLDRRPHVVAIDDSPEAEGKGRGFADESYEALLARGAPDFAWPWPEDEWQAISLNYTSGTTGRPKGVVYHHRGAYLNALSNVLMNGFTRDSVYLWTLPMFHCNGWTHIWAVTAAAGTHICQRRPEPAEVFQLIAEERVTHMAGAPVVLGMLINAPESDKRQFDHVVEVATGGAAPPAPVIAAMEAMGFNVTHLYGLTEVYGPALVAAPQEYWPDLPLDERAALMARQGVRHHAIQGAMVADPETLAPVPADGATVGEIMLRGNTVMKGYLDDAHATAEAFRGGWFHSGDLAVTHPDGYIQVTDRAKDIIISGGENISSIEVENALYSHEAVLEAAVVARPDATWGETPCAFVALKPDAQAVSAEALIDHCRQHLARFKAPRTIVFGDLPKTATGKIMKFELRERARALSSDAPEGETADTG